MKSKQTASKSQGSIVRQPTSAPTGAPTNARELTAQVRKQAARGDKINTYGSSYEQVLRAERLNPSALSGVNIDEFDLSMLVECVQIKASVWELRKFVFRREFVITIRNPRQVSAESRRNLVSIEFNHILRNANVPLYFYELQLNTNPPSIIDVVSLVANIEDMINLVFSELEDDAEEVGERAGDYGLTDDESVDDSGDSTRSSRSESDDEQPHDRSTGKTSWSGRPPPPKQTKSAKPVDPVAAYHATASSHEPTTRRPVADRLNDTPGSPCGDLIDTLTSPQPFEGPDNDVVINTLFVSSGGGTFGISSGATLAAPDVSKAVVVEEIHDVAETEAPKSAPKKLKERINAEPASGTILGGPPKRTSTKKTK